MNRTARWLVSTCLFVLAGSQARAAVIWRGDFSTGNLSQWTSTESINKADRLQVVTSPSDSGFQYALRTLVKKGDVIYGGNRNELTYEKDRPQEGDDRYYHWKTMFPADYQSANYWQLFTQWHQYIDGGSPPLAFMVVGEQIKMGTYDDKYPWTTPLVRGQWLDFVFHVKWSSKSNVGGAEIWYNGKQVLPFTYMATLFPNDTVYLKQGLYRKDLITWDQIVYHTGMVVGTTLADVATATPTPSPTPSPSPSPSPTPTPTPTPSPSPSPSPSPTPTPTPTPSPTMSFADSFATCTSTTNLGSKWGIAGKWYCKAGAGRGETAAGLALAQGSTASNMSVQARVQLTASASGSGVIARASSSTYYAARLLPSGSAQIIRVASGKQTVLATVPMKILTEPTWYRVQLDVTGSTSVSLTMSVDGVPKVSATDTSTQRIQSGQAGLLSGTAARTQYKEFSAKSL